MNEVRARAGSHTVTDYPVNYPASNDFPTASDGVIDAMNHFELNGRKLRVEYKKMLPAAERERIERDRARSMR